MKKRISALFLALCLTLGLLPVQALAVDPINGAPILVTADVIGIDDGAVVSDTLVAYTFTWHVKAENTAKFVNGWILGVSFEEFQKAGVLGAIPSVTAKSSRFPTVRQVNGTPNLDTMFYLGPQQAFQQTESISLTVYLNPTKFDDAQAYIDAHPNEFKNPNGLSLILDDTKNPGGGVYESKVVGYMTSDDIMGYTGYEQWFQLRDAPELPTLMLRDVYTIGYDGNGSDGGTVPADVTDQIAGNVFATDDGTGLTRSGHALAGWLDAASAPAAIPADGSAPTGMIVPGGEYTVSGDATLYAVWAVDANGNGIPDYQEAYTILYDEGTGTGGPADETGKTPGDHPLNTTDIPTHAQDGGKDVVFLYWTETANAAIYGKDDVAPTQLTTVTITNADVTVYAAYGYDENGNGVPDVNEDKSTIIYDENGGVGGPADEPGKLPGTYPLTMLPEPTHAQDNGKDVLFIGWTAAQDAAIYAKGDAAPATISEVEIADADVTVYAAYGYDEDGNGSPDAAEATVTFKVVNGTWDGTDNADKTAAVHLTNGKGTLSAANVPTGMKANSGYTGGAWDTTPNTTADGVTGDVTYTYSFTKQSGGGGGGSSNYTLTYETNGGSKLASERHSSGTTVKLTKTPTREGYTFTGWYADKELANKITEIKMNGNKTVYAGWGKSNIPGELNGDDHFAYIMGREDGLVRPNANITRAEVATIFYRLLNEDVRKANETTSNSFTDVSAGQWYDTEISTIANLGIVEGRGNGIFAPDAPITRAEFATIAARFDSETYSGADKFPDISGHWAAAYINRAAQKGWVQGDAGGNFRPNAQITRAEAVTLINRVLQRLPESTGDLLPGMKTFPDNMDTSAWYYLAIQEAANGHDYERKADGVHEKWTALTQ